jgi:hypothetical protein
MTNSFTKDKDFVTRTISGETIIVPIRGGVGELDSIYTLNEVGTRIWQLLDGQTPTDQIIETVALEYDVAPEEAATDVNEFLASLEAQGLIRPI